MQAPAETAAAPLAAAPAAAPAPAAALAAAPTGYVGEPPADAAWLAQREAAFSAVRSDYEAARSLAQAQPLTPGGAPTPGWVATQPSTDESGQLPPHQAGSLVFIPSTDTTPVVTGYDESGPVYSQPAGQWLAFNEAAFALSYQQAQGGAPLQSLARLYDSTPAALLGAHPELWGIATTNRALNAGPPPAGRWAMPRSSAWSTSTWPTRRWPG